MRKHSTKCGLLLTTKTRLAFIKYIYNKQLLNCILYPLVCAANEQSNNELYPLTLIAFQRTKLDLVKKKKKKKN